MLYNVNRKTDMRCKMITIKTRKANKIKIGNEYSIYVSFDYNNKIVETIRSFPHREYNPVAKEWELPLDKLKDLTEKLPEFDFTIEGPYIQIEEPTVPVDFDFKTKPFSHQIDGFNFGIKNERWLLGDEQGLGKTKQVIDIAVAKKLQKGYKHCLIICGVNGLKWNWYNEIKTHSNETPYILGQRVKNGKLIVGSNNDKLNDVLQLSNTSGESAGRSTGYFIITNIETLRNNDITAEIVKLCKDGTIGMIAFDECHKAKNPSSQQGKGILKLQSKTMIAMTGTPLMNTPLDLYIILKWLGYERHAFYSFKNHYCVMGGYGGYEIVGYKNLDELQTQLNTMMLRRLKSEVLDLPEKTFVDEYVEMTGKQEQIYKEVTAEVKANIDQISIAPNPLAQLIRMRQATGYTGILSSTINESAKLDRMEELVEEAVENGQQVVIFSNWTQMTDVVWARLHKKYRVSVITGETKDVDRQDNVNEFQTGASQVLIGTIGAMGTGLTLTAGTVEIFLDEPWNRALKDQAVDRCHRIGQNSNVTIYTLMCKNTIDERIHELVEKKGAMSDAIVDGQIKGNKTELLQFLLS